MNLHISSVVVNVSVDPETGQVAAEMPILRITEHGQTGVEALHRLAESVESYIQSLKGKEQARTELGMRIEHLAWLTGGDE